MKLIEKLLQCPQCKSNSLKYSQEYVNCLKCENEYQVKNNIPLMFLLYKYVKLVRGFVTPRQDIYTKKTH